MMMEMMMEMMIMFTTIVTTNEPLLAQTRRG